MTGLLRGLAVAVALSRCRSLSLSLGGWVVIWVAKKEKENPITPTPPTSPNPPPTSMTTTIHMATTRSTRSTRSTTIMTPKKHVAKFAVPPVNHTPQSVSAGDSQSPWGVPRGGREGAQGWGGGYPIRPRDLVVFFHFFFFSLLFFILFICFVDMTYLLIYFELF